MSQELAALSGGVPAEARYLQLPRAVPLFEARAARLRALSDGHAAGDWLRMLARLCDAQAIAARQVESAQNVPPVPDAPPVTPVPPVPPVPPLPVIERELETPLARLDWRTHPGWRVALARILDEVEGDPLPGPARDAVGRLRAAGVETLAAWAAPLLGEGGERPGRAAAPFLGAALQVLFTSTAEDVPMGSVARAPVDCPVCGAPAMAGTVMGDDKVRYLTCSLCASSWHRVRVQCATCGSPSRVSYYAIEDGGESRGGEGVKAEACGHCRTYLKLFYREQRPAAEPLADDVATLALDLLMGQEGFARGGINLLLAI